MSDLFTAQDRLALGLELSGAPRSVTQATGLGNLAPSSADWAALQQATVGQVAGLLQTPPAPRTGEQGFSAYFNPGTNQMFAGGRAFDVRDVGSALQAAQALTPSPPPPGGGWQAMNQRNYADYIASLSEPRGTGELLARGARGVVGGLVGGVGRGIEMLGAPETGGAIAGVGEAITGQDEFDRQRSALIQRSNSTFSNILDAVVEGVPSVFASIGAGVVGGIAGGAIGGPGGAAAGAAAAATLARARTIGAIGGLVATSFPQQLNTFYEAAANARTPDGQPAYDVTNPQTQLEILGGAVGTTLLDVIAPGRVAGSLSRALTDGVQQASTAAVTGLARARSVGGAAARSGLEEAATEATQTLLERAVFDPQFRSQLTTNDWKALAPYIVERYGEDILIAAGAGAFLGAGFGGAGRFIETRPRDLLQGAGQPPAQQGRDLGGGQFGPPMPEQYGPFGPEPFGPPAPTDTTPTGLYGYSAGALGDTITPGGLPSMENPPAQPNMVWDDRLGIFVPAPIGTRAGGEQFGPPTPQPYGPPAPTPEQFGPFGPEQFGPTQAQPVPPPPVVPQRPPLRTAANLIPPTPSAPTGAEALRRPAAQAAPTTLAETEAGNRLLALRRQMELQQAEAQRAAQPQPMTAAERDYEAALAQAAANQPVTLDATVVVTGRNRAADNARRSVVEQFNGLTAAQQNEVLAGYGNDPAQFLDRVRQMPTVQTARVRSQLNRIAEAAPAEATIPTVSQAAPASVAPAPAAPAPAAPTPAARLRGGPRAAETGQVAEGGVGQRPAAREGRAAPEAGRGNRTLRRGAQPQAQAQEVAAAEAAPPRPLEAAPARAAVQRPNYDELIDRAERNGELPALRADLEARIDRESDAGRSTTELSRALERVDERLAAPPAAATAEGVLPPNSPQSRWAAVMDDEGAGYNRLSTLARQKWDSLVANNAPLSREVAREVEREFPTQDTQAGLAFVGRLKKRLDGGVDDLDQVAKILDQLERLAGGDNAQVAAAANEALGRDTGQFSLADWNTRSNWKNADGTDARPMAPGRARILVQNFLSKLATKPKVTVVANQQALRTSNPALFARANAARSQGDFATANAAGYSFGDGNVIIFTDRIANEQHLRFVLAHETFGHFGMRGIMPGDKFNALMERIYDTDPQVKAAADAAMEVRGISKAEAVEEFLSDTAATLATSTVARVWNAIKNILSRLGIRSGNEATRYFLDQARRYVRDGSQGVTFDADAVAKRLHAVETANIDTGRYSPEAVFSASTKSQLLQAQIGAWPTNWNDTINTIIGKGKDFANTFDDIKSKFFSLANYRALENPGLYEFDGLMGRTNQITMAVKDRINEYLRPLIDSSEATQTRISKLMYAGRSYAISKFDNDLLRGEQLFTVDDDGNIVRNNAEAEKLFKAGLLTKDQIRKGFSWDRTITGLDGKPQKIKGSSPAQPNFTDAEYDLYVRARRAVFSVEMELLEAEYASLAANRRISYKELNQLMRDAKLDAKDRTFVNAYVKKYGELYTKNADTSAIGVQVLNPEAVKNAEDFLVAVNAAFIGRDTDRNAEVAKFFDSQPAADAFIEKMMEMKARRKDLPEAVRFDLQKQVKQLYLNTRNVSVRERIARRGIATGYIPALREGNYQMRLQAFVGNKPVEVKDVHQSLMAYSQFDQESSANEMAKLFNGELKGKTFEVLARDETGEFVPTKVTLRATTGRVLDAVAADPQLNLQDFLYGMSLFNIDVNPRTMEKLVTTLTRQESAARNRLEFSQTSGFDDTTGIYAISRHIEARASTIAKTTTRQPLRELMNLALPESRALWTGNEAYLNKLRAEVQALNANPKASRDTKAYAQRALERAEFMYRKTNPTTGAERSMVYYNEAANTLSFLDGSKFVDESNFGAGPVASRVRAYTSMMQLGGSLAQGALNLISPYTNWMPYMASYNSKNAFGGGFGLGKVQAEYHRAFIKIGAPGATNMAMNRAEFYDNPKPTDPTLLASWKPGVAQSKALRDKYGLTVEEAQVMAREIREGKLIPAQSNALMATARGYTTNRWLRGFSDVFMSPFNLSEQAARRSAFLAAYRLYKERATAAGRSEKDASAEAREEAIKSIDLTLGEYSVLNRPPAWRDGIQSFLYMYKTYPTTTIQMLARLPRPAQLSALGGLWLLAGATGLPFAEDLEDLIDTLAQGLGFQQGSVRAALIRHMEEQFPGLSPYFLRGVVNQIVPADVASRVSAGNFIPGTGMFLAGSNVTREISDIMGPAAGFITGTVETARNLVTYPFSSTKTLEDIARSSPVTFLRIMGDSYAYLESGAVVDRRGYVVSPGIDPLTIFTRMVGFYPERAATQYDIIRIAQRETDYQKEVVAAYRQAWIKATMRGDIERAQEIVAAVNNWNETARGTPLEITRFVPNSVRALREAQRGAGERALRAAPRAAQEDIRELVDALTQ